MPVKTLKNLALLKINFLQVMKAESHEKEVISQGIIEIYRSTNRNGFSEQLEQQNWHPCRMKTYRVWYGNYRLSANGTKVAKKPRTFKHKSICKCKCEQNGPVCECACGAIVKMMAEFRIKSRFMAGKTQERCNLNELQAATLKNFLE